MFWQCTHVDSYYFHADSTDLKVFGSKANGGRRFLEMCVPVLHSSHLYFLNVVVSFLSIVKQVSEMVKVFFQLR